MMPTLEITVEGEMASEVHRALYGLTITPLPDLVPQVVTGTIADLYGLPQVQAFSLYGVDPHCDCNVMEFCRNPLHPGPCKGWKRTLGAVAPGALKALEADRIAKAEEKRKAAVKRYTDAGKKVPARLKKPITSKHLTQQAGAGGAAPLVITGKPTAPTSTQIADKIAARRAAVADIGKTSFLSKKASDRLDVYKTLKDADVKAMPDAQRKALEFDLANMAAKFPSQVNKDAAAALLKRVKAIPGGAPAAPAATPSGKPRDGDGDGKLNEVRKPGTAAPAAAAPPPAAAPATPGAGPVRAGAAGIAADVANGTAPGRITAKRQMDAYQGLTRAEFDTLDPATQSKIRDDLTKAEAKFLDPKKKKQASDLLARFDAGSPAAPAAAPSAPATPTVSPESKQAGAALVRFGDMAASRRSGDAEREKAAAGWESMSQQERETFAEKFAEGAGRNIATKTQTYSGVQTNTPEVQKAAADEIRDNILGRRTDTPLVDAMHATWRPDDANKAALRAELAKQGLAPAHGLEKDVEEIRTTKNHDMVPALLESLDAHARTPEQQAAFEQIRAEIENDPTRPVWVRASAAYLGKDFLTVAGGHGKMHLRVAARTAKRGPGSGATFTPFATDVDDLYNVTDAELATLPTIIQEAIKVRRDEAVNYVLTQTARGSSDRTETMMAVLGAHPSVKYGPDNRKRINELNAANRDAFAGALVDHVDNEVARGNYAGASSWQRVRDDLDGRSYSANVQAAVDDARDTSKRDFDVLFSIEKIDKSEYDDLPDAHAINITDRLTRIRDSHPDLDMRRRAALHNAELEGNMPAYSNSKTQEMALAAGHLRGILTPQESFDAFYTNPTSAFEDLNAGGKMAVTSAMQSLVDSPFSGLSVADRMKLQLRWGIYTGAGWSFEQKDAMITASRAPSFSEPERLSTYEALDQGEYLNLPPFGRETIDADLETLKINNPLEYDRIKTKLDPTYVPPSPVTPVTAATPPNVTAALDVVYGSDPKARTSARQLSAYGGLKAADFGGLGAAEQQTILNDLSFIETTSKSSDAKARARKLIDRFTPPGTPLGTMPASPAIIPPSSAATGQTRFATPQIGLSQSSNPGQRGDEWMTVKGSSTRVWGKYGAAGLLLRHVDPVTGEQRFLIAERGPAISSPGLWQLPGGAIESKETPKEGATRETLEELGFKEKDFATARVHGFHEKHVGNVQGTPTGDWKYTSFAVDVDSQLPPDLSTAQARAETSDAKWMTLAEIDALDRRGKILGPLAGGQLQANIISLFPTARGPVAVAAPGPVTRRQPRLAPGQRGQHPANRPAAPATPYKQRTSVNLVPDKLSQEALLTQIKDRRKSYRGKAADERLAVINNIQGNDRTPTVVSKAEMDRLLATGDYIEIWRGVKDAAGKSAKTIAEEFRSGPDYGGLGIFGNGYYFAENKELGEYYAGGGWRGGSGGKEGLIRALLPKSALTISIADAKRESQRMPSSTTSSYQPSRAAMGGGTLRDAGRYSAAKGMDAIKLSANDYRSGGGGGSHMVNKPIYNLFNRSILIVQEA